MTNTFDDSKITVFGKKAVTTKEIPDEASGFSQRGAKKL